MMTICFLKIILFLYLCVGNESFHANNECENIQNNRRSLSLSFNSKKNETGEWTDSFVAKAFINNESDMVDVDIKHKVLECQGVRVVTIIGQYNRPEASETSKATERLVVTQTAEEKKNRLLFHPICGKSVVVTNGGKQVRKIQYSHYYTAAFTNRPLKDGEIFEVKLEKKSVFVDSLIIGVISNTPENTTVLEQMYKSEDAWAYVNRELFRNGKVVSNNYGQGTKKLEEGNTLGLMRSKTGGLYFFFNEVPEGMFFSGVPSNVYGFIETGIKGLRVSIVET